MISITLSWLWFPVSFNLWTSLVAQMVKKKNLPVIQETWIWSLGQDDPLEKGLATHSSILAWRIPWTEETGGLQSMGSQRVGHNLVTEQQQSAFKFFCYCILHLCFFFMFPLFKKLIASHSVHPFFSQVLWFLQSLPWTLCWVGCLPLHFT